MLNDLPGISLSTLTFAGGYSVSGNSIALTGHVNGSSTILTLSIDLQANNASLSNATVNGDIAIHASNVSLNTVVVNGNVDLVSGNASFSQSTLGGNLDVHANQANLVNTSLAGTLSGTGPVTMIGMSLPPGTHPYSGTISLGGNFNSWNQVNMPLASIVSNASFNGSGTLGAFTQLENSLIPFGGTGLVNTGNLTIDRVGAFGFVAVSSTIAGTTPGVSYGQVNVTGTVTIGTASLGVSLNSNFIPGQGQEFIIINNDGNEPVAGTFGAMPEGAVVTLNGVYQFALSYSGGDGNDVSLTSINGKPPSSTALGSSSNPSPQGASVVLTATVSTASGTATGAVAFFDGTTNIGSATLDANGIAAISVNTLTVGSHSIRAQYGGDGQFGGSSSPVLNQVVTKISTATAVTSSPNPAASGALVTFTATVSSGAGIPTGTVTFKDAGSTIGSGGLSGGVATFSTAALGAGSHVITADYGGDANFASSNGSLAGGQTIDPPDTTPPTVTLNGPFNANIANQAAVVISGTCSESTRQVDIAIASTPPTSASPICTSGAFTVTVNLTTTSDGTYTVTAQQTDAVGNGPTVATSSLTKDTSAPSVTVTPQPINATNQGTYVVTGTCSEDGRIVSVQIDSVAASGTCTVSGTGTYATAPVNVSTLSPGNVTITAVHADAVGNSDSDTVTVIKDTVAPTTLTIGTLDFINNANKAAYGFGGSCEAGGTAVSIQLISGPTVSSSAPCVSGSYSVTALNVSGLLDGTVSVLVTQQDLAGNSATTPGSVLKDVVNPMVTIDPPVSVTSANQSSYVLSGTCSEAGRTVTITAGAAGGTASCGSAGAGAFQATLNLSALPEGSVSFSASISDTAGNTATGSASTTKDTIGPNLAVGALSVINGATSTAFAFGGSCEAGSGNVTYTLTSGATVNGNTACSSGNFTVSGLNVTTLSDGAVSVTISQTDSSGNANTANSSTTKDTANPVVAFNAPVTITPGNRAAYPFSGTCSENGRAVAVMIGNVGATATCTTGAFQGSANVSSLADGSVTLTASHTDAAGNVGTASASTTKVSIPPPITRLSNLSTRGQVQGGNDVIIAGFIVGGTTPKTVVVNVAGPSLTNFGITGALANPTLVLVRSADNAVLDSNDDWQSQGAPKVAAIQASGFQPNNPLEPAIVATLQPGAYTAIVQGAQGGTGIGLVGVFEVDHPEIPLSNISTRGRVAGGADVMIAGFIVQGTSAQTLVINVAGPSLASYGISNPLLNPRFAVVRSSDQAIIATNDDWQNQAPAEVAAIQASGFQPNDPREPAVRLTLNPGAYTVIVDGVGNGTGVALVGVFTQ